MDSADPELHTLQATSRFSNRAEDYRRYRPDYPAAAIETMLRGLAGTPPVAADVGAGTGISARQLAERGVRVLAIEPNAEMRAVAAPHPRIEWRDGTAESTGLATASLDLVLCAQSFHWFHPREAVAEFGRVLHPGGRLALMWNARDEADPFTSIYTDSIHAIFGEHPAERIDFDPAILAASGRFANPRVEIYPHAQSLDLAGLIGRAASSSYVPKEGPDFDRLRELLATQFMRHRDVHGFVALRYRTELYLGERL